MQNDSPNPDEIDRAFASARVDLQGMESLWPQIAERIGRTRIKAGPGKWLAATAAVLLVASGMVGVLWHARNRHAGPTLVEVAPPHTTIQIGGAEFTEYLTGLVNQRLVVAIWSFRGKGVEAASGTTGLPSEKYDLLASRQRRLGDGRTVVCSVLAPRTGVLPILQPPKVWAKSGEGRIGFSVWPRGASVQEISQAVVSAGAGGEGGVDVLNLIQSAEK